MVKNIIGIGTIANDGTGDTLRLAAIKINQNFYEIYEAIGDGQRVARVRLDFNNFTLTYNQD